MTEEQQKEQFSIAYIRAVAASACVNIYRCEVDEDSIDLGFSVRSIAGRGQSPKAALWLLVFLERIKRITQLVFHYC